MQHPAVVVTDDENNDKSFKFKFFPLVSIWCYYAGISTLGLTCKDTYTAHTPKYQNNNKHNVTRTQSCYTGENAH